MADDAFTVFCKPSATCGTGQVAGLEMVSSSKLVCKPRKRIGKVETFGNMEIPACCIEKAVRGVCDSVCGRYEVAERGML